MGALFIHYLQPRLRNDYGGWFKGVTKQKVKGHLLFEGIVVLVMVALISSAVIYQSNSVDDRVSSGWDLEILISRLSNQLAMAIR